MQHSAPLSALIPFLDSPPNLSGLDDPAIWAQVRTHAAAYGVAPLIASAVRGRVTPEDRVWCDEILTKSWRRHDRILGRVLFVAGLMRDAGVPALSLKGPLLARRYYNPPFLRKPSIDVDMAVLEEHLGHACEALGKEGYSPLVPLRYARKLDHHVTMIHPQQPCVELHFRLTPMAFDVPIPELFERATTIRLPDGADIQVLSPADQLMHLVLHLAKSRFSTLFHLYEVRRAFEAEPEEVRAEAVRRLVQYHFCGALRMTNIAMEALWGKPLVPPESIPGTWLGPLVNERLYRRFEEFGTPCRGLDAAARTQGRWMDFQITDRPLDGLRSLMLFARNIRYQMATSTWNQVKEQRFTPGV